MHLKFIKIEQVLRSKCECRNTFFYFNLKLNIDEKQINESLLVLSQSNLTIFFFKPILKTLNSFRIDKKIMP